MSATMSSHVSMDAPIWLEVTNVPVRRDIDSMLIIEHVKTSMNARNKTSNAEKVRINFPKIRILRNKWKVFVNQRTKILEGSKNSRNRYFGKSKFSKIPEFRWIINKTHHWWIWILRDIFSSKFWNLVKFDYPKYWFIETFDSSKIAIFQNSKFFF